MHDFCYLLLRGMCSTEGEAEDEVLRANKETVKKLVDVHCPSPGSKLASCEIFD